MSGPKLIVFACDGTLVDSAGVIAKCMADAFQAFDIPAPSLDDVRVVIGLPLETACARVLAAIGAADAPASAIADAYKLAFRGRRAAHNTPEPLYPGVAALLRDLAATDAVLGVATGKSQRGLRATLGAHGLLDHFMGLQTADDAPGKPAPDMLLNLSRDLGCAPDAMVMIGDTTFDMEMAAAAGVRAIGVAWGYHPPDALAQPGAAEIAADAAALRHALDAWMAGGA